MVEESEEQDTQQVQEEEEAEVPTEETVDEDQEPVEEQEDQEHSKNVFEKPKGLRRSIGVAKPVDRPMHAQMLKDDLASERDARPKLCGQQRDCELFALQQHHCPLSTTEEVSDNVMEHIECDEFTGVVTAMQMQDQNERCETERSFAHQCILHKDFKKFDERGSFNCEGSQATM